MVGVGSNLPDNTCLSVFDAPNYLNWASANWRRDFPNGASAAPRSDEGGCRMPDVLGYTDSDGNQRMYKVPVERFDEALGAIEAEDYSALGEFEEVTSTVSD
ncbi:hypothetical protein E4U52_001089 [Claviceps spartinae]|nr:hypothetical protein E4U52_001089 [Claviceps spartinae]